MSTYTEPKTYLGAKTAAEMLRLANETHLLGGHYIFDQHYASLPPETIIHVWKQYYRHEYGSGYEFLQSLEVEGPTDVIGYTYELEFEF